MPKKRKSSKQLEKDRQENRERMSEFCKKKTEEQALKDSLARQQALKQLGITQEFNYSDHAEIYNYADRAHAAPIETIDSPLREIMSITGNREIFFILGNRFFQQHSPSTAHVENELFIDIRFLTGNQEIVFEWIEWIESQ